MVSPTGGTKKVAKNNWRKVDIIVDYNTSREISKKRRERDLERREERRERDSYGYGRRNSFVVKEPRTSQKGTDNANQNNDPNSNKQRASNNKRDREDDSESSHRQQTDKPAEHNIVQLQQDQQQPEQDYW